MYVLLFNIMHTLKYVRSFLHIKRESWLSNIAVEFDFHVYLIINQKSKRQIYRTYFVHALYLKQYRIGKFVIDLALSSILFFELKKWTAIISRDVPKIRFMSRKHSIEIRCGNLISLAKIVMSFVLYWCVTRICDLKIFYIQLKNGNFASLSLNTT